MEKFFWGEAIQTATYLCNRSPSKAIAEQTPAELWFSKKINMSNLRVFGSIAYVHIPSELRTKLASKSRKCIMIGYSSNGYRLWDPEHGKVVIARDVVFNEHTRNGRTDVSFYDQYSVDNDENDDEVDQEQESDSLSSTENTNFQEERKRDRWPPVWHTDYEFGALALNACMAEDIPKSIEEVDTSTEKENWKKAIQEEYDALMKNNVWELVEKP